MSCSEYHRTTDPASAFLPYEIIEKDSLIGNDIKQAREEHRTTQKELATLSGISPVHLCRIEKNESVPSKDSLKALAPHIGISYTDLLIKAGYNSTTKQAIYLDKTGKEIDTDAILAGIYYSDAELLSDLQDILTYATHENVALLRLLIKSFKKERDSNDILNRSFCQFFSALKNFLKESLTIYFL